MNRSKDPRGARALAAGTANSLDSLVLCHCEKLGATNCDGALVAWERTGLRRGVDTKQTQRTQSPPRTHRGCRGGKRKVQVNSGYRHPNTHLDSFLSL